jgi:hypothetical protein
LSLSEGVSATPIPEVMHNGASNANDALFMSMPALDHFAGKSAAKHEV